MCNKIILRKLVFSLLLLGQSFSHAGIWDDIVDIFSSDEKGVEKVNDIAILEYNELNDLRTMAEENQDVLTEIYFEKRDALNKGKEVFISHNKLEEWDNELEKRNKKEALDAYMSNYHKNMRRIHDEYQSSLIALNLQVTKEIDSRNDNVADIINLFSENYTLPKKKDGFYIEEGDFDAVTKYCVDRGFESGDILAEKIFYLKCVTMNEIKCPDGVYCDLETRVIDDGIMSIIREDGTNLKCAPVLYSSNSKMDKEKLEQTKKAHKVLRTSDNVTGHADLWELLDVSSYYTHERSPTVWGLEVAFSFMDMSGVQLFARKLDEDEYGNKIDESIISGERFRGSHFFYNQESERYMDHRDVKENIKRYGKGYFKDYHFKGYYNIGVDSFYLKTKKKIATNIKCSKEPTVGQKIESQERNIYSQFQGVESKYLKKMNTLDASRKHTKNEER